MSVTPMWCHWNGSLVKGSDVIVMHVCTPSATLMEHTWPAMQNQQLCAHDAFPVGSFSHMQRP